MTYIKEDRQRSNNDRKTLYICSLGTGCFAGVMDNLLILQSSINVKKGIGPISAILLGVVGFVNSLLICSILIKFLKPKMTMILGEIAGTLYTVANFYVEWYTMIPGSMLLGFGESLVYVASTAIVGSIGNDEIQHQGNFSVFVIISSACHMIIGLMTELTLSLTEGKPLKNANNVAYYNSSQVQNLTDNTTLLHVSLCGSRDCPADYSYKTHSNIFDMLIPNQVSLFVLLSIYVLIQITGICLHWFVIHREVAIDEEIPLIQSSNQNSASAVNKLTAVWKRLLRHLSSAQAILVLPAQILTGMAMSFFWTEYTRSFISCTIGVENVGICSTIFYLLSGIAVLVLRKCKTFGVIVVMSVCMLSSLVNYIACLLWNPTVSETSFVPYIVSGLFGIQCGTLLLSSPLQSVIYFSDHKISLSVQMSMQGVGYLLTYSWSVALCVYVKLYVMLAFSIFSIVCWAVAHIRYHGIGVV